MRGKRKAPAGAVFCFALAFLVIAALAVLRIFSLDAPHVQLAAAVAAAILVWTGASILYEKEEPPRKIMRRALFVIFAIYLLLLVNFTIFDGHFGRAPSDGRAALSLADYFKEKGNILPFKMIINQTRGLINGTYALRHYVVNIAGNLAAFAPFALFLPLLFKRCRRPAVFFAAVTAAILLVEACQLLTRTGSFDVDDYILNMLGVAAAYALLSTGRGRKFKKWITDPEGKDEENNPV